jgi:chorismate synthase
MSSVYGKNITVSIFGQSHSQAIGVSIDGLPSGRKIDLDALSRFLQRRAPGNSSLSTKRKESDTPEILSGLVNGVTCGAPLTAIIRNTDIRSEDYDGLLNIPRPSHADYAAEMKYHGAQDASGGGHFSGRLTAPLCIAGGICLQLLSQKGIEIAGHISSIAGIPDTPFDPVHVGLSVFEALRSKPFPVLDDVSGQNMQSEIRKAMQAGDSVGGIIECAVLGLPAGIGGPMFDGMENRIARAVFGIPAIKGIEFGNGFLSSSLKGSENNDPYYIENNEVKTKSNNHGGILGGITTGMPLIFRAAVKPTPSIALEQQSVSLIRRENVSLSIKGRHDPCIVPRAVPCIEAACALAVYDALLDPIN